MSVKEAPAYPYADFSREPLQKSPVGIVVTDPSTSEILYCNDTFMSSFGIKEQQLTILKTNSVTLSDAITTLASSQPEGIKDRKNVSLISDSGTPLATIHVFSPPAFISLNGTAYKKNATTMTLEEFMKYTSPPIPKEDTEDIPDIDNPVSIYLAEIRKTPLLSHFQEVFLAKLVDRGSTDAKKYLTKANLRLVVSVARRYSGKGVELLDLIQEGNDGLMIAVDKYRWEKGFRFSTYAHWWIRQSITRSISFSSRTIRIPAHIRELKRDLFDGWDELRVKLKREPSKQEVAQFMGISVDDIDDLEQQTQPTLSINAGLGEDDDSTLEETVSNNTPGPEDVVVNDVYDEHTQEAIKEILSILVPRERLALSLRTGFGYDHPHTLEEARKIMGISRERVRQLELGALRRIKGLRATGNPRFKRFLKLMEY